MKNQREYKVELRQSETYIIDVFAKNQEEAKKKVLNKIWDKIEELGIQALYQTEGTEREVVSVYDVTNTDDPFSPIE